jgi:hypothetical protein
MRTHVQQYEDPMRTQMQQHADTYTFSAAAPLMSGPIVTPV